MKNYQFKLATLEMLDQLEVIIEAARERMAADGLIQWQDGKPDRNTLENDIAVNQLYVLTNERDILGLCVINDDYYEQYVNGPEREKSLIIHRFATNPNYLRMGIGKQLIEHALAEISKRGYQYAIIDTNSKNVKMRKLIENTGFEYISDFELIPGQVPWVLYAQNL